MAIERLAPDAILTQTNLVGTLADVQNDPDVPDATWLTATDQTIATVLRVSFPTPSNPMTGIQEFRARVRRVGGTDNPPINLELWINGTSTLVGPSVNVVNTTDGEIISWTWDAGTYDAAAVECRVNSPSTGGKTSTRATCEIEAIEWNATIRDPGPPGAISNLVGYSGGATSAILDWDEPTTGSTATYRVFRDTVLVGTTTDTKYRDTGLTAGTAYSYTVQPFNDLGDGPMSAAISVTPVEFSMNDSLEGAEGVIADNTNTTASTGLVSAGYPTFRAIAVAPETTATGVLFPAYSGTTAGSTSLDWQPIKLTDHRGKFYFRMYARFAGYPPTDTVGRFVQFGTEAGFNAVAMGVWLSTTGNMYLSNTTTNTSAGSIGIINTNEWIRIETSVDLFSKEIVLRVFRASTNNLHGNTPDAEVTATSASTASIINSQRVGWAYNSTPWPDVHIDELKWSNRDWLGSAVYVAPLPSMSTLSDDFDDGVLDTAKWTFDVAAVESNGVLSHSSTSYARVAQSTAKYDFTGSSMFAKITRVAASYADISIEDAADPATNYLSFGIDSADNSIYLYSTAGATTVTLGTYDPTTDAWMRMRNVADLIYADTSPDGTTWTERGSIAAPTWKWRVLAGLWSGYTGTNSNTFDNFNISPEPPPGATGHGQLLGIPL